MMNRFLLYANLAILVVAFRIVNSISTFGFKRKFSTRKHTSYVKPTSVKTKWIYQPLDHNNPSDNRTWKMRYFQRQDMWKLNGPIFIQIDGEYSADENNLQYDGLMYELAKETNGAMFQTEHRYYGESKPFKQTKYTTEHLTFLSSKQALADIANLIKNIKSLTKFKSSKVVVVGGSYAGNLAAWMRLLYPNLVDAAVAGCAPVLAKVDFTEYFLKVSDIIDRYGTTTCIENIANIILGYQKMFKTNKDIKSLKKKELICKNTDMHMFENQQFFIMQKSDLIDVVQCDDINCVKE